MLDASIACSWCFPDDQSENTPLSRYVLTLLGQGEAIVPELWAFEVANIMTKAVRGKRISLDQANEFVSDLRQLPIRAQVGRFWKNVNLYTHAIELGLTSYDAAYLSLAKRRSIPLATNDDQLGRAAVRAQVNLIAVPSTV